MWCRLAGAENILIGVCYRTGDSDVENDVKLFTMLENISENRLVIMGDFNFPELNWSNSEVVDSSHPFVNSVAENLLSQHVCT